MSVFDKIRDNTKRPNFLVIGAQKAGTTWLFHTLRAHPDVYMPDIKEISFFRRPDINENTFKNDYLSFFKEAAEEKAIGEATPGYFWVHSNESKWSHPSPSIISVDTISEYLGNDLRLILSLRNPVERAISGFYHHYRKRRFSKNDRILDLPSRLGIIDIGFYHRHLMSWLEVFPRDQFLILNYEKHIKGDAVATVQRCYDFLDIDASIVPTDIIEGRYNVGLKRKRTENGLIQGYRKGEEGPIVTPEEVEQLRNIYRKDIENLSPLVDWDPREWLE